MNDELFSLSVFPSLPRRGGRAIRKMFPFRKGAVGVVNHKLSVIDHYLCFALSRSRCAPVCGIVISK